MKNKTKYLITTERKVYICSPYLSMDFYTLEYCPDTEENIERFLKEINPRETCPEYIYIYFSSNSVYICT